MYTKVIPYLIINWYLKVGLSIILITLNLSNNGIVIIVDKLIVLFFTSVFTWAQSISNISLIKSLLSATLSPFKSLTCLN